MSKSINVNSKWQSNECIGNTQLINAGKIAKFAELHIVHQYADMSFVIELCCRHRYQATVEVRFDTDIGTDPKLLGFIYQSESVYDLFIAKEAAGVWGLYFSTYDGYDAVSINRVMESSYDRNAKYIKFVNCREIVSAVPDGATRAVLANQKVLDRLAAIEAKLGIAAGPPEVDGPEIMGEPTDGAVRDTDDEPSVDIHDENKEMDML